MNDFCPIHRWTSPVTLTSHYQILLPQTRVIGCRVKILNNMLLSECSGLPCVIKLTKTNNPSQFIDQSCFMTNEGRTIGYMLDSKRRTEIRARLKGWYFEYNNQPFSFSSCIAVYCYNLYWPIKWFWKHVEVLTPRLSGGEVVLQTYGFLMFISIFIIGQLFKNKSFREATILFK